MMTVCSRVKLGLILAGLGIATATAQQPSAPVATLLQPEGRVLVNKGSEYMVAESGLSLQAGDRVVTMESSAVVIAYEGGCESRLGEYSQITVSSDEECRTAAALLPATEESGAAIGAAAVEPPGAAAAAIGADVLGPEITFPIPSLATATGLPDIAFYVALYCGSMETMSEQLDCSNGGDRQAQASPE